MLDTMLPARLIRALGAQVAKHIERMLYMRAIFIEVLIEKAKQANLGIAHGCLDHFVNHVDGVIKQNTTLLLDRKNFAQAYSELEEFVDRMIQAAKATGATELHEPNFFAAKAQCGLIFWCTP
jgi:hypothetical protein